uniref:Ketoreductase domain-containing protein n=4 Tax=Odontella aurita TaxID=265563 RepID=A0A7S4MQF1_9STRA|mmetsp:Transcript_28803/g.84964  ORF Transcript_28803/g.84964 Transcript_28803/m.84964 type:complete len:308 (+) Transcript_28803:1301-2224(+)
MYNSAPKPQSFRAAAREWRNNRIMRRREAQRLRRVAIMDELIALQHLKRRAGLSGRSERVMDENKEGNEAPLGYALVTGASRGIGRAIAVELARWEVPLILVARDIAKLTSLAADLVTCYGVKVCILQADLAKPDAAAMIHRTTKKAGLKVDVLVNNAGVCTHGELVESNPSDIQRMVQVNSGSVAMLSHLYGKDMKHQRRGRVLFVSSVVGAVPAGPGVAIYAATKAFEKALALSMSRELEKNGIGVTVMCPGAVKGTEFAKSSMTESAACWKLPFYPRSAPEVATRGVRALLAGDPEVYPGWQNR